MELLSKRPHTSLFSKATLAISKLYAENMVASQKNTAACKDCMKEMVNFMNGPLERFIHEVETTVNSAISGVSRPSLFNYGPDCI